MIFVSFYCGSRSISRRVSIRKTVIIHRFVTNFGCSGLRRTSYCVLNEQCASPEEYFRRKDEIVEELRGEGLRGQNLLYEVLKEIELGDIFVLHE